MTRCIDLLRHGEPEGGRRYRGHGVDHPLSATGWRQMWDAVGDHCPWDRILSSPLQRCRAFAEALAARHGLPLVVDERLREVGFGTWEGRTPAELQAEDPEGYAAFYADPVHRRPPGAEPLKAFIARVTAAFDAALQDPAGGHLLWVVHAGVIRAVVARVLQAPPIALYRMRTDYAGLSRVCVRPQGVMLQFHNRPRLAPEPGPA